MSYLIIALAVLAVALVTGVALVVSGRNRRQLPPSAPRPGLDFAPGVGDDAEEPRDTPTRTVSTLEMPDVEELLLPPVAALERPEPTAGRLRRLRDRLTRSSGIGRGVLALLSRGRIDEDTWDEVEDLLITADLGVGPAQELVSHLRARLRPDADPATIRTALREELLTLLGPDLDRSLRTSRHVEDNRPAVVLVVGVNGVGKTTTVGKIARMLVADDRDVILGAADTFRAAATEQLATWGDRVGAVTVRGPEGSDPASVAFEAVKAGIEQEVDVVLVDTAGRLHTKTGLMDELGKVKRVVEKHGPVDEVLLVLDATTGQNGMTQARVFAEVVSITGIVLTKLDGTAKGGIIVAVQRELSVPVKLVGLGEGPDDLAVFDAEQFVDAIIGDPAA